MLLNINHYRALCIIDQLLEWSSGQRRRRRHNLIPNFFGQFPASYLWDGVWCLVGRMVFIILMIRFPGRLAGQAIYSAKWHGKDRLL